MKKRDERGAHPTSRVAQPEPRTGRCDDTGAPEERLSVARRKLRYSAPEVAIRPHRQVRRILDEIVSGGQHPGFHDRPRIRDVCRVLWRIALGTTPITLDQRSLSRRPKSMKSEQMTKISVPRATEEAGAKGYLSTAM
jgi:hypothetical protein